MKTVTGWAAVLLAMTIGGRAEAGLGNGDEAPIQIRLELDLADGSRVIGVPSNDTVSVQTPYARMNLPLKQVAAVRIENDRETASIAMRNGDALKGLVTLDPIQLETVFGKVKIGIEHVSGFRVMLGGDESGLILWNKMGSDEEVRNSAVGPKGNVRGTIDAYAPGVFGNAAHLRGSDGEVFFDIPYLENKRLGTDPFTVAFWAKSSNIGQPEGFIMDSYSKDAMMIRIIQADSFTMHAAIPAPCTSMRHQWDNNYHHYAIVFHSNGRSVLYVDKVVKASSSNASSIGMAFSQRIVLSGEWNLTDGYDWSGYVDDVKAWNYAKTDFSDQPIE